ncbi:MAG: hypothetical protein ACTHN0_17215 [Aquihabitans sp.]
MARRRYRIKALVAVIVLGAGLFTCSRVFAPETCGDYLRYSPEKKMAATRGVLDSHPFRTTLNGGAETDAEVTEWAVALESYCSVHKGDQLDDLQPSVMGF